MVAASCELVVGGVVRRMLPLLASLPRLMLHVWGNTACVPLPMLWITGGAHLRRFRTCGKSITTAPGDTYRESVGRGARASSTPRCRTPRRAVLPESLFPRVRGPHRSNLRARFSPRNTLRTR